jgi:two-component system CheB/CheR fusion protein
VVQHLDPSRPSLLPEILAKRVSMPVFEAVEDMDIEADHLYVIPPNTSMSVEQCRIRLRPRDDSPAPPMPIDDLLDSLARDQGQNAIGIVLSGSGSDGALGLQAIQRAGGITFAQDEASAHFNSMPHAAISLGCVDRVLAPRDIAKEMIGIGQHPYLRSVTPPAAAGTSPEPAETSLRAISACCGAPAILISAATRAAPSSAGLAAAWHCFRSLRWRTTSECSNPIRPRRWRWDATCSFR